ncbi:MAG: chromate transporter [Anaerotignum sp.]
MSGWAILFFEFFKIGLLSFGGGLATLPFLYKLADKYNWFDYGMIADMVAISESTPGPLGINMATYTGYQFGGALGSIVATAGLVFPSVVIIIWISKFLEKFRTNPHVENAFYTIRPTVTGLIGAAGFSVIMSSLLHVHKLGEITKDNFLGLIGIKECILFIVILVLTNKYKKHPIVFIGIGAAAGMIFAL